MDSSLFVDHSQSHKSTNYKIKYEIRCVHISWLPIGHVSNYLKKINS